MTIWVFVLLNAKFNQVFINTFDSKIKCQQFIKKMEPIHPMTCVEAKLNPT